MDLSINGQIRTLNESAIDPSMPLLWALRDVLDLTGTKFGCGVAACGACTVHVDGLAVRSCVTPLASIGAKRVVTIEALGSATQPHALQTAWLTHQVPQCGYCQSGMLMAAAALLARNANPSDADIDAAITNICRCGTYPRIRMAIKSAAVAMRGVDKAPVRGRPKPTPSVAAPSAASPPAASPPAASPPPSSPPAGSTRAASAPPA